MRVVLVIMVFGRHSCKNAHHACTHVSCPDSQFVFPRLFSLRTGIYVPTRNAVPPRFCISFNELTVREVGAVSFVRVRRVAVLGLPQLRHHPDYVGAHIAFAGPIARRVSPLRIVSPFSAIISALRKGRNCELCLREGWLCQRVSVEYSRMSSEEGSRLAASLFNALTRQQVRWQSTCDILKV